MYRYWGFGLNIESEIEFPELLPFEFNTPDLTIKLGDVPQELKGHPIYNKLKIKVSVSEYLLDLHHIARYYAHGGREIIIAPYPGTNMDSVRLFMLSNSMAAILHQKGSIPLHASGIITDKGVILFTGRSGIGKSTTVMSLVHHGYRLFCDDVCVAKENQVSGKINVSPSYPMIKLWENTVDHFHEFNMEKKYKVRPNLPKYGFFQHDNFTPESIPVYKVFVLRADNMQQEFSCKEMNKLQAFNAVQQNTYRRKQVDMMQLRQQHFNIISRLCGNVPVMELSRPLNTSISGFIDFVKDHL